MLFFFFQFNLKYTGVHPEIVCLAFCGEEIYLQMWNLAAKINDQFLTVATNKRKKHKWNLRHCGYAELSQSSSKYTGIFFLSD